MCKIGNVVPQPHSRCQCPHGSWEMACCSAVAYWFSVSEGHAVVSLFIAEAGPAPAKTRFACRVDCSVDGSLLCLVFGDVELPSSFVRQCPMCLLQQSVFTFAALLAACCAAFMMEVVREFLECLSADETDLENLLTLVGCCVTDCLYSFSSKLPHSREKCQGKGKASTAWSTWFWLSLQV